MADLQENVIQAIETQARNYYIKEYNISGHTKDSITAELITVDPSAEHAFIVRIEDNTNKDDTNNVILSVNFESFLDKDKK